GGAKQRERKGETQRFSGLEIEDQLNFCDLLHRQIGRLFALETPAGVGPGLPPSIKIVRSIAHKTSSRDVLAQWIDRGDRIARYQRDDLIAVGMKKTVAAHQEGVSALLNKICKGRVDLACATCIHERQAYPTRIRCIRRLFGLGFGKKGVGRVAEVSDRLSRRHQFEQLFEPLCGHLHYEGLNTG